MIVEELVMAGGGWPAEVDRLRSLLGAPANPLLFPPHFLKTTFPKIGGRAFAVRDDRGACAAAFLFPHRLRRGRREYVLRLQCPPGRAGAPAGGIDSHHLAGLIAARLDGGAAALYRPEAPHTYPGTHLAEMAEVAEMAEIAEPAELEIDYGEPDEREAALLRRLQRRIWGAEEDFLYPEDIHSAQFSAATSLVARKAAEPVGFLVGFAKFGGSPLPAAWPAMPPGELRLESQMLGVLGEHRARGIGFALKKLQAAFARRAGVAIVNWTVDPLQFPNAVLNFTRLRAVACRFHRHYLDVRNELNRVPASRLEVTWNLEAESVRQALAGARRAAPLDLAENPAEQPDIQVVDHAGGAASAPPSAAARRLAFEVPADWTALQRQDPAAALAWREATDALFARFLGHEAGQYMISDTATRGERRYLIAERIGSAG
jgi:predicted GNAT superfamily acetyltransferase